MKIGKNLQILSLLFLLASCTKKSAVKPRVYAVSIATPIQRDTPLYLEYVGHIEAFTSVEVTSQIEGVLMERHFKEGDEVKKGDLLFTIDPRPYIAEVESSEAQLAQDIANLKYAEDTARRYSKLIQDEYVSKLNYEQYLTNVVLGEAKVKGDIASLEVSRLNLDYCYIKAPMDAVAGNVAIDVGNLIPNAGTQPLVRLNQILPVFVTFYVPEKDLPSIQSLQRKQQPVSAKIDKSVWPQSPNYAESIEKTFSEKEKTGLETQVFLNQNYSDAYTGYLSIIDNQVDESTGTILLKSTFANKEKKLWPGEFVDVRLILGIAKSALLLPSQAVQIGQTGNYLYVLHEDNTVELRQVKIGQKEKDYTIVEQGLKMGEKVVLEGQVNLYDGAHVSVKKSITGGGP